MQFSAWYSLSRSLSTTGNSGDELDLVNIQNSADPFNDVQFGPSRRSDARHRVTISAIIQPPWGIQVSPIWRYRSALPVNIIEGVDLNNDGVNDDIPLRAFAFDGRRASRRKDIGACKTINCGRGAACRSSTCACRRASAIAGQHAHRGDRRGVQPVQREEPVGLRARRRSSAIRGC